MAIRITVWERSRSSFYLQPNGPRESGGGSFNRILRFSPVSCGDCVDSFQPSGRSRSMQTISLPYRCSAADRVFMDDCRRVYSAAVRTAYANGADACGVQLKQKPLRDLVKSRFAGGFLDSWALHCATLEGMDLRKRVPNGRMVFGSRTNLERRRKGLIESKEWKRARLRPMTIRGDKLFAGTGTSGSARMAGPAPSPCSRVAASRAGRWSGAASCWSCRR